MEMRPLGRSGIEVSAICLGTMTYGVQNSETEAFEQMDRAFDAGVNFFDMAEMYPVRQSAETQGRTEEIVGKWARERGLRDQVIIATKVVGPGGFPYIRGGETRHNREHITAAVETSLQRLGCETIDLYQLHWPDRSTNTFGKLGFKPNSEEQMTPLAETLGALDEVVKAGKVRTVGLSNETPWGAMTFLALSEAGVGPRMVSIQNPYSLLNRTFEAGLAEVAIREDLGLLAYAPAAAGALSGKYLNGAQPVGARMTLWPDNRRYRKPQGEAATRAYVQLAARFGLDPIQMANAFVLNQPFCTSAIIGATKMTQLENSLAGADLVLSEELMGEIEALHSIYTYPCP